MDKKMTICFIGCGRFAKFFVPLFKAHPVVEKVYVCDQIRERAEQYSKEFDVEIIETFEDALASEDAASEAAQTFANIIVVKEGSEFTLDVDTMIMSIGTSPNPLIRTTTPGLDANKHGCIVTQGENGLTSREGVYAGGDANYAASAVGFSHPVDLSKITSVKLRF